jgi:putative proteasome-type protease
VRSSNEQAPEDSRAMTYCVALNVRDGLVMLADTRTNAGADNVRTFRKLHVVEEPGERVLALMMAGNLAVSQAVLNLLTEGIETERGRETLQSVPTVFRAAHLLGAAVRQVYQVDGEALQAQNVSFDVSFLLGGQIAGGPARLFQVYAAGNFIEAGPDTPFLQIGEHKYGKPILDRALSYETPLEDGIKLVLISMDSTLRSNLTVGLPVDLLVLRAGALRVERQRRINEDDPYFRMIRERWSSALREAYQGIPRPSWE